MASRVAYGMARQGVVPSVLGRVHKSRRTPWVAIVFVTLITLILVSTGNLSALSQTTVALLIVFTLVNIAVLVLRRDPVGHHHFRTPTVLPILGALTSLPCSPSRRPASSFGRGC